MFFKVFFPGKKAEAGVNEPTKQIAQMNANQISGGRRELGVLSFHKLCINLNI